MTLKKSLQLLLLDELIHEKTNGRPGSPEKPKLPEETRLEGLEGVFTRLGEQFVYITG